MLSRHLFHSEAPANEGPWVPSYLSLRDVPWLRALLVERARFVGKKQKDFAERLREPLEPRAPRGKLELVRRVLEAFDRQRPATPVPPKLVRLHLFLAASAIRMPRPAVLDHVARELGTTPHDLERALFADLRGERRVSPLPPELTAEQLAIEANRLLVSVLLRRAASVRVRARGNTPQLLEHIQRLGLICLLESGARAREDEVRLDVSGPFALFRHTGVYGRALASLIPRALLCDQFELEVACALDRKEELATVVVRSSDPIGRRPQHAATSRGAEERFARVFSRIAKDWYVVPKPRGAGLPEAHLYASLEVVHRARDERWWIELAGYWTRAHVEATLSRLRAVAGERFVLCIDERRKCGREEVSDPRILRYRGRIDPAAVLAVLEAESSAG